MSKRQGKGGSFEIGGTPVGELESWSLSEDPDSKDAVAMGDSNKTTRYGAVAVSGELTLFADPSDAGQTLIEPAGLAATATLYPEGNTSGKQSITFTNLRWASRKRDSDATSWIKATVSFTADSLAEGTV